MVHEGLRGDFMKWIKYNFCTKVNHGTEENPQWEDVLNLVMIGYSEANEEIAKREAYNGEYTIEDDGQEEVYKPTAEERLAVLEAAMLEMIGVSIDD